MSGFGWDDGTKLVIAGDEQWTALARVRLKNLLDFVPNNSAYCRRSRRSKGGRQHPFPSTTKCILSSTESSPQGLVHSRQGPYPHPGHLSRPPIGSPCLNRLKMVSRQGAQLPLTHHANQTQCVVLARSKCRPPLTSTQDEKATNKSETETDHGAHKKHQQSKTPEPGRTQKHCRQQQQDHTEGLITEMTQAVWTLSSSLQPASTPQLPQERRVAAIKLMQDDRDFAKSECVPVLRLFTSSIDVVDSYLVIGDKEIRTMYIKAFLDSQGPS